MVVGEGGSSSTPGVRFGDQKVSRRAKRRSSTVGRQSSERGLLLRSPGFCTRTGPRRLHAWASCAWAARQP
jgi:hypothetical protein